MIGKLITYGKDRREAMDKMSRALSEYMITGIKTTIPFEQAILQDPNFRRGVYSTSFIEQLLGGGRAEPRRASNVPPPDNLGDSLYAPAVHVFEFVCVSRRGCPARA